MSIKNPDAESAVHKRFNLNGHFKKRFRETPGPHKDHYEPEFYDLIEELCPNPQIVVEIGASQGVWASKILARFESIERYFAIDPWPMPQDQTRRSPKVNNFDALCMAWQESVAPWLFTKAIPLRGFSGEWGPVFPFEIDLLYVDGNHTYRYVLEDLKNFWPKVRRGGLMICDDLGIVGVPKALNAFFKDTYKVPSGRDRHEHMPNRWGHPKFDVRFKRAFKVKK